MTKLLKNRILFQSGSLNLYIYIRVVDIFIIFTPKKTNKPCTNNDTFDLMDELCLFFFFIILWLFVVLYIFLFFFHTHPHTRFYIYLRPDKTQNDKQWRQKRLSDRGVSMIDARAGTRRSRKKKTIVGLSMRAGPVKNIYDPLGRNSSRKMTPFPTRPVDETRYLKRPFATVWYLYSSLFYIFFSHTAAIVCIFIFIRYFILTRTYKWFTRVSVYDICVSCFQ